MRYRYFQHAAAIALLVAAAMADFAGARAQQAAAVPQGDEAPYLAENNAAMDKMMADMTVKPTGDVDADFVAMMIPHHQGAIDMALAVLRYGSNERIRRIAQEIVVEQQQEIIAMRLALGQPLPPPAPAPTEPARPVTAASDPPAMSHHGTATMPSTK